MPGAGEAVTIGRGKNIVLDVSPPALRSLTIHGKLSFSNDRDLKLTTEWIYVAGGEFDIGSEAKPYTHKATIILTDNFPNEDINTMGDRGIMMLAGTLNLHGDRTNSWTKLANTAKAGSSRIEVLNAAGWRKGDVIVLASTDFDPHQAEERTIAAIRGNAITLDKPLKYMHFGKITDGVDERGEVGMLTRNIKIQASADSEKTYFGGHIMAMAGSKMYVSGVELYHMGQYMHLARYPIHWHLLGDAPGQYVQNSSIHDSYSRCVTVHGTNDVRVQNNVTYNTVGHCYFLEDAVETGNKFIHNLAILTKCHPDGKPCEPTNLGPAGVGRRTGIGSGWPEGQGCPDPVRQHGVELLDHQSGQHLHRQCGRGVRGDGLLVSPCRCIRRDCITTTTTGHVECGCASSRATPPIRTSTASCSTAAPTKMVRSVSPEADTMSPFPIRLTRTASRWCRSSRISPATRTGMAASGAAASYTCSRT